LNKIIIYISFILICFSFLEAPLISENYFRIIFFPIIIISTIAYFNIRKKKFGKYYFFSITPLFIFGYFIVYFQMHLIDVLGYKMNKNLHFWIWADDSTKNLSLQLSSFGLLAFYCGLITAKSKILKQKISTSKTKLDSTKTLVVISYVSYFVFLASSGSYILGEYTPEDASPISSYSYKIFKVFLSSAILVSIYNMKIYQGKIVTFKKYLSFFSKPLFYLITIFLALSLIVGDRGPIIYFLILTFSTYLIRVRKKIPFYFIIYFILSINLMSFVGDIRQSRGTGISYVQRIQNLIFLPNEEEKSIYEESIVGESTSELSTSIRTLNYTIYNVPNKFNYTYGYYQIRNLIAVIPGMSTLYLNIFSNGEKKFDGASNFVTFLIQGERPTSGDGSSILVDFYLDFGKLGVLFGMFFFGFFINKNENKIIYGSNNKSFSWIAIMIYFSLSIYISRSSLLLEFGNIILIFLSIKINTYINNKNTI
jgi:hypothetical protein